MKKYTLLNLVAFALLLPGSYLLPILGSEEDRDINLSDISVMKDAEDSDYKDDLARPTNTTNGEVFKKKETPKENKKYNTPLPEVLNQLVESDVTTDNLSDEDSDNEEREVEDKKKRKVDNKDKGDNQQKKEQNSQLKKKDKKAIDKISIEKSKEKEVKQNQQKSQKNDQQKKIEKKKEDKKAIDKISIEKSKEKEVKQNQQKSQKNDQQKKIEKKKEDKKAIDKISIEKSKEKEIKQSQKNDQQKKIENKKEDKKKRKADNKDKGDNQPEKKKSVANNSKEEVEEKEVKQDKQNDQQKEAIKDNENKGNSILHFFENLSKEGSNIEPSNVESDAPMRARLDIRDTESKNLNKRKISAKIKSKKGKIKKKEKNNLDLFFPLDVTITNQEQGHEVALPHNNGLNAFITKRSSDKITIYIKMEKAEIPITDIIKTFKKEKYTQSEKKFPAYWIRIDEKLYEPSLFDIWKWGDFKKKVPTLIKLKEDSIKKKFKNKIKIFNKNSAENSDNISSLNPVQEASITSPLLNFKISMTALSSYTLDNETFTAKITYYKKEDDSYITSIGLTAKSLPNPYKSDKLEPITILFDIPYILKYFPKKEDISDSDNHFWVKINHTEYAIDSTIFYQHVRYFQKHAIFSTERSVLYENHKDKPLIPLTIEEKLAKEEEELPEEQEIKSESDYDLVLNKFILDNEGELKKKNANQLKDLGKVSQKSKNFKKSRYNSVKHREKGISVKVTKTEEQAKETASPMTKKQFKDLVDAELTMIEYHKEANNQKEFEKGIQSLIEIAKENRFTGYVNQLKDTIENSRFRKPQKKKLLIQTDRQTITNKKNDRKLFIAKAKREKKSLDQEKIDKINEMLDHITNGKTAIDRKSSYDALLSYLKTCDCPTFMKFIQEKRDIVAKKIKEETSDELDNSNTQKMLLPEVEISPLTPANKTPVTQLAPTANNNNDESLLNDLNDVETDNEEVFTYFQEKNNTIPPISLRKSNSISSVKNRETEAFNNIPSPDHSKQESSHFGEDSELLNNEESNNDKEFKSEEFNSNEESNHEKFSSSEVLNHEELNELNQFLIQDENDIENNYEAEIPNNNKKENLKSVEENTEDPSKEEEGGSAVGPAVVTIAALGTVMAAGYYGMKHKKKVAKQEEDA